MITAAKEDCDFCIKIGNQNIGQIVSKIEPFVLQMYLDL